jgi:hypothetical protein
MLATTCRRVCLYVKRSEHADQRNAASILQDQVDPLTYNGVPFKNA